MDLKRRWLPMTCLVLLMGGCSWFNWLPWVGEDEDKEETKPAELVDFTPELSLQRQWKAKIGEGLGKKYLRLMPVVVADTIIAADGYGEVEALDRFSGKRIWQAKIGEVDSGWFSAFNFLDRKDPSFVSGGVGSGDGLIVLGTTLGFIIALDAATGAEQWRTDLGSEMLSAAAIAEGMVYAQSADGRLVALDRETGELRWTYDNQLPILTLRGTSSPVVDAGIVYAGFANGKLVALRATNGEPIWEHRVMLPEGRSELERMVDVDTKALLSGPSVFIGAYQGRVKSLSRRDGRALWEREISTFLDLAEGYGQVYAIDENDVVTAIEQQTGEVAWEQEDFKRRLLSPPLAFSNYLVFGDAEGYLHVIAQRDGRHLGRRKVDGDGIRSMAIVANSIVYVLGNSGSLQSFEIELK